MMPTKAPTNSGAKLMILLIMCPYWFLDTVVIVFQQKHSKIAVLIVLMASQREVVVISFLYAFDSKMVAQILPDDLLFPVLAIIVDDDA